MNRNFSSLLSFWLNKDKIRYIIPPLYFLRTCSISAPNLTSIIFGSSSIYLTELTFWLTNISLNYLLYQTKHLSKYSIKKRFIYSIFLSTIFNFGSIMIVNNLNHFFSRIELLKLISNLTLSTCLLSIGYYYFDDLNKN